MNGIRELSYAIREAMAQPGPGDRGARAAVRYLRRDIRLAADVAYQFGRTDAEVAAGERLRALLAEMGDDDPPALPSGVTAIGRGAAD